MPSSENFPSASGHEDTRRTAPAHEDCVLIPEQVAHLTSLASSGVAGGIDDLVEDRDRWRTQADLGWASPAEAGGDGLSLRMHALAHCRKAPIRRMLRTEVGAPPAFCGVPTAACGRWRRHIREPSTTTTYGGGACRTRTQRRRASSSWGSGRKPISNRTRNGFSIQQDL